MTQTKAKNLLDRDLTVLNVGVDSFTRSVSEAGVAVQHLDWRPAGNGDPELGWKLAQMAGDATDPDSIGSKIDRANAEASARMLAAQPVLVDVALRAEEIWPELWVKGRRVLTHAGAPVAWDQMCSPMQGTLIGAMIYEGWAKDDKEARAKLAGGEVEFMQNHDLSAVGPMSGTISPSMPVLVVKNTNRGNMAYSNLAEGIGKVLRFGAYSQEVLDRLKWMGRVLAPTLKAAVKEIDGGIDLKSIQAQALLMGDEVHSRNTAATALFYMAIGGALAGSSAVERASAREALDFIGRSSQFFLNFSMAACKAIMDATHGVEHSSIITAIARNGVTTGIRISGLGKQWFESPSDTPQGLFFPGFKQEDSNADLGDSAICETAGYGGQALAASPALVQLVGGTVAQAMAYSREMYHVTWTRNPSLSLPTLEFEAAPSGIDVRKVVDTGIRPVITTGIAHKQAGIGQIGAGIVRVPMDCCVQAVLALSDTLAK